MKRLRYIREQAGLSQPDLAEISGVGQGTISDIELGKRKPQGRTLRKLAQALGVEVAALYGEPEQGPLGDAPPSLEPSLFEEEERRAEQEAERILDESRANLALLRRYLEDPPDEDSWDAALEEHWRLPTAAMKQVNQILEQRPDPQPLSRRTVAIVREALRVTTEHHELGHQLAVFNEAQYGHRHKETG